VNASAQRHLKAEQRPRERCLRCRQAALIASPRWFLPLSILNGQLPITEALACLARGSGLTTHLMLVSALMKIRDVPT